MSTVNLKSNGGKMKYTSVAEVSMRHPYLEDVLLPVNDSNGSIRCNNTNISRMQPPFLVNGLLSLGLILEVSRNYTRSTDTDLSSRVGFVGRKIVQFGDVDQLDLVTSVWWPNVSCDSLVRIRIRCRSRA